MAVLKHCFLSNNSSLSNFSFQHLDTLDLALQKRNAHLY